MREMGAGVGGCTWIADGPSASLTLSSLTGNRSPRTRQLPNYNIITHTCVKIYTQQKSTLIWLVFTNTHTHAELPVRKATLAFPRADFSTALLDSTLIPATLVHSTLVRPLHIRLDHSYTHTHTQIPLLNLIAYDQNYAFTVLPQEKTHSLIICEKQRNSLSVLLLACLGFTPFMTWTTGLLWWWR